MGQDSIRHLTRGFKGITPAPGVLGETAADLLARPSLGLARSTRLIQQPVDHSMTESMPKPRNTRLPAVVAVPRDRSRQWTSDEAGGFRIGHGGGPAVKVLFLREAQDQTVRSSMGKGVERR